MPTGRARGFDPRQRRSSSARVVVLGAVFAVIVGASLVVQFRKSARETQPQIQLVAPTPQTLSVEMVDCLVAVEKIEAGSALEPVKFRKETRAITGGSTSLVTGFEKLRGSYAASFIAAGQPLLVEYLTSKAPINVIQANIPDGYRAVAVGVDDVSNVEGWVRAGAKVDVMLASQIGSKPVITMLVQNAKVLSSGKLTTGAAQKEASANSRQRNSTTITIMVTVEEASKIQLASSSGVMSLSLRGDEDTVESSESTTVTIDSIFGLSAPKGTPVVGREGTVKVGSRTFEVIAGKLVPQEETAIAPKSK